MFYKKYVAWIRNFERN